MAAPELNTNLDPELARSDLNELFKAIFFYPNELTALRVHEKLGLVALVEGSVEPYVQQGIEFYRGDQLYLGRYTNPDTAAPMVRAWGPAFVEHKWNYDLSQTTLTSDEKSENAAIMDRTLAHICGRTAFTRRPSADIHESLLASLEAEYELYRRK